MATDVYKFSEGFQSKILALMARDKNIFITYRSVFKPQYFRKDLHIDLARIIINFYEAELARMSKFGTEVMPPTKDVLLEEIRKLCESSSVKKKIKEQYDKEVDSLCSLDLSDSGYVLDNIVQFGKKAALEHAILKSVDVIEKDGDFEDVRTQIDNALQVGEDISDLGVDYFATIEERMEMYSKGSDGTPRVPTGLEGLDRVIGGGLGHGELGVVIAPPNRGKSITLTNIGVGALLYGRNVVHYSLEMRENQVNKRYDCRITRKDINYIRQNLPKVTTALMNVSKSFQGRLIVKKYPTSGCSVNTIRSHLTRLYIEKKIAPGLIIIDYGDLLAPLRNYKDKRFELESIYGGMRDLGEEFDCPVWTASQANRGSLSKKIITMGDLAEAFNKANIADIMVALCQTDEEKDNDQMRLFIAKHREGESSIILPSDINYPSYELKVHDSD